MDKRENPAINEDQSQQQQNLTEDLDSLRFQLEEERKKNAMLEKYCAEQEESYAKLFNLFANNVDYILGRKRGN